MMPLLPCKEPAYSICVLLMESCTKQGLWKSSQMDSSSTSGRIRGHTNIYKGTSLLVLPLSVQGLGRECNESSAESLNHRTVYLQVWGADDVT